MDESATSDGKWKRDFDSAEVKWNPTIGSLEAQFLLFLSKCCRGFFPCLRREVNDFHNYLQLIVWRGNYSSCNGALCFLIQRVQRDCLSNFLWIFFWQFFIKSQKLLSQCTKFSDNWDFRASVSQYFPDKRFKWNWQRVKKYFAVRGALKRRSRETERNGEVFLKFSFARSR